MGDRNYGILWMIWIGMFWTCILFALPYTTFLLFELGYWWMLPILIITYVYVTAYSFFIFFIYPTTNPYLYVFFTYLVQAIFISTPFIINMLSAKGAKSNSARRNAYQRPASTLPLQKPRII